MISSVLKTVKKDKMLSEIDLDEYQSGREKEEDEWEDEYEEEEEEFLWIGRSSYIYII